MDLEPTRHLRLRLTFARNPASHYSNGEIEHWEVCVYEVRLGSIRYPFEVTGELQWIYVPDKWDDFTKIPAHREIITGVRVDPVSIESFVAACKRARELALVLSGYMEPGSWLHEERHKILSRISA
jgi:hypothetical protein